MPGSGHFDLPSDPYPTNWIRPLKKSQASQCFFRIRYKAPSFVAGSAGSQRFTSFS